MLQFAGFLFDLKIMPRHRPKAPASSRKMKQRRKWERETEGYGKEPKTDRRKLRVVRGRSGASAAPRRTKCVKREGAGNTQCGTQKDGRRQYAFRFPKFLASLPVLRPPRSGRARGTAFGQVVVRPPLFIALFPRCASPERPPIPTSACRRSGPFVYCLLLINLIPISYILYEHCLGDENDERNR